MLQNYHRHIMNVKRIFEKFCMEVNVIGFKECYETKNIFVRLIWASCLSVGFIMTIYFMCSIVIDYRSNPTVTKIYFEVNETYRFPSTYLINQVTPAYYSSMGMSPEAILYVQSWILENFDGTDYWYQNETIYQTGKEFFEEYCQTNSLTSVFDLMALVERFDNFTKVTCDRCDGIDIRANWRYVDGRIFYQIPFKEFSRLEPNFGEDYGLQLNNGHSKKQFKLTISKDLHALDLKDVILLPLQSTDFIIRVDSVQRIKRYRTHGNFCINDPSSDYNRCMKNCALDTIEKCGKCRYVRSIMEQFQPDSVSGELCSWLNFSFFKCLKNFSSFRLSCNDKCLPPCDELSYHYAVEKNEVSNKNAVKFILSFTDNGILTYEEVSAFNFYSAISDIGGQLGLWLGMGVITIIQIFVICLKNVFIEKQTDRNM